MENALGTERGESVLARITPATRSRALDELRWMDAKTIASLIMQEHPQVAALVLSHLEPTTAADVLPLLPVDRQADVIYRVATLESVDRTSAVSGKRVSISVDSVGGALQQ